MAVLSSLQTGTEIVTVQTPHVSGLQKVTKDVTITSVDTTRTIILFGYRLTSGASKNPTTIYATTRLLNATTLRLELSIDTCYHDSMDITFEWQVVEYSNA